MGTKRKQSLLELFPTADEPSQQPYLKSQEVLLGVSSKAIEESKVIQKVKPSASRSQIIRRFDGAYSPQSINFRDKEYKEIQSFIQDAEKNKQKCRCLLLTGMPGAGKTLLSKRILNETLGIRIIAMNANVVMNDFVSELSDQLVGAKLRLHQLISHLQKRKTFEKVFVMVDQFDSLFKNASAESLDIFKIFSSPIQNVSLIGTSNSMEIMQTLSNKFNLTLPAVKNVVFSPYKIDEIKKIITDRASEVKQNLNYEVKFDEIALKYAAAKLSNVKGGDVRFVLEQTKLIVTQALDESMEPDSCLVRFQHACHVLTKLNKSLQGSDIMKNLPFQQSMCVVALYRIFIREECLEVTTRQLEKQITNVQKVLHLDTKVDNLLQILRYLEVYGFIGMRQKKKVMQVSLKVNLQTIKSAYEDDPLMGRYFWE